MEEQDTKIIMFVRAFYNDSNLIKRLEFCYAIGTTLDNTILKKITSNFQHKDILKYIESILNNEQLIRNINHRYSLSDSSENNLYFGKDFGYSDTYHFLPKIEKQMSEINLILLKFINNVLKELKFEEDINLQYT